MSSIVTNDSAMVALQNLQSINKNLGTVSNQIATGMKVNNAFDNAAVWSIATSMNSDVSGFESISESLNLGKAGVKVARDAAESVTDLLTEMKQRIVASQEENVDRGKIQADIEQLYNQVNQVVDSAQFNGLNFLKDGGAATVLSSLDRGASGTVTASQIYADRQNLQTNAATLGATAVTTGTDEVVAVGAGTTTMGGTVTADTNLNDAESVTIDFDDASFTGEGHGFTLTFGGVSTTYVARQGDTMFNVLEGLSSQLQTEMRAAGSTYDGVAVTFSSDRDDTAGTSTLTIANNSGADIAVGADDTDASTYITAETTGGTAGGGLADLGSIDVTTEAGATQALTDIEGFIQTSIDAASGLGSVERRLEIQGEFVNKLTDSMKAGIGALVDANMEKVSAEYAALQVQQQLGAQALGIANGRPQILLSLFR
ncbi:MAG: flagellin [Geminicoccaceae bacterium]